LAGLDNEIDAWTSIEIEADILSRFVGVAPQGAFNLERTEFKHFCTPKIRVSVHHKASDLQCRVVHQVLHLQGRASFA
jgi:hypothetical protein